MIKSNLGSGYVRNIVFDHFVSRDTAYGLDINQYWASQTPRSGDGVHLSNITFSVSLLSIMLVPRNAHCSSTELGWQRCRRCGETAYPVNLCRWRAVLRHHPDRCLHVVRDQRGGSQVRERIRLRRLVHQEWLHPFQLRHRDLYNDEAQWVFHAYDDVWGPLQRVRHQLRYPYSVSHLQFEELYGSDRD